MEPLLHQSLAHMFFATCDREDFPGWYHRKHEQWIYFSRQQLARDTRSLALAFKNRGIKEHQSIGIVANSCPEWIMTDIASQLNHAQVVPLFPNISSDNFNFQCDDSDVQILLLNNVNELDQAIKDVLPRFSVVICIDPASDCPDNGVYWHDLIREGQELAKKPESSAWIQSQLESINPDDLFSIIYTSGSTGRPKGAELSHRNMLAQIQTIRRDVVALNHNDVGLVVLPVAHVLERMTTYFFILNATKVFFADTPKNTALLMKEVKPTVMMVVPRILERVYESMTAAGEKCHGFKRWLINRAVKIAKIEDPTKRPSIARRIYDKLVYKKMREAIGGKFRLIVCGGGALNKSICRFLLNVGINICEGYGLTECAPVLTVNTPKCIRPGSVGIPLAYLDVKIGENSEVLAKGDSVFKGYHNMPEVNKEIFTEDGYLKTGDQGSFDEDGYLFLIGRIKELLKTSTGKYVSPNPIELEISRHPLVEQALVIANDRKFASVLIFLNPINARRFLNRTKDEFDINRALESKHINEALERHITRINKKLNHWEQIRKWTLIGDSLSVESGLLTPTLKIRRKAAEEKYAEQIERMYK